MRNVLTLRACSVQSECWRGNLEVVKKVARRILQRTGLRNEWMTEERCRTDDLGPSSQIGANFRRC